MKIKYTHNIGLKASGIYFESGQTYPVDDETGKYLLKTFSKWFKEEKEKKEAPVRARKTRVTKE